MSRVFLRQSLERHRRRSRMYSCRLREGLCAMSERIPFPITDEMARAELKPLRRRGFMKSSMVQLTLARFRGFIREPEAVFWTFVFPILLAVGLGVAFRSRAPERPHVAVVTSGATSGIVEPLKRDSSLLVEVMDDSAAARALRTGRIALIARVTGPKSVEYTYDPVRGDAASAKLLLDRAVQHAAGRVDP